MNEPQGTLHAVDLDNSQWLKIFRANRLLRAWVGVGTPEEPHVERAPKEALSLKVHQLSADLFDDYEVRDDGFFTTQTTTSSIEFNMMMNGFSKKGVNAALAGGAQGLLGGVKADIRWGRETSSSRTIGNDDTVVHCYYTCPRVTVLLNENSLCMSPDCKSFLEERAARNPSEEDLDSFFKEFGGLIARTVWLGGRLYSWKTSENSSRDAINKAQASLEAEFSASLISPFLGLSLGVQNSKGQGRMVEVKQSKGTSSVSVYAQGGSAFLAENSLEWAKSLAPYQTWRVIQQEHLEDVLPFLLKVVKKNYEHPLGTGVRQSVVADENGGPTIGAEDAQIGSRLVTYLEKLNKLWEARKTWQEQTVSEATQGQGVLALTMEYGTRLRFIETRIHRSDFRRHDWYDWTLYVRPSSTEHEHLLDRIEVDLDRNWFPKFPVIARKGAHFEYHTKGWGSVKIKITLVLQDGFKFTSNGSVHGKSTTFDYQLAWPEARESNWESKTESKTFEVSLAKFTFQLA